MSKCKDCAKYKGNCGHHDIDNKGHINYEIPAEYMYDLRSGGIPNCFEPIAADLKFSDLYDKALNVLHLAYNDVEDYRPADPLFIPELKQPIPGAIILWLKSGEKIIYFDNK